MNMIRRIKGSVSIVPINNDYDLLVNNINNNLAICDNNEKTISSDIHYSIGDLIIDICNLMYSVNYNNEPHHYTNMSAYLRICIQFVNDIIQQISIFETSLNERANIKIAEENLKTQSFTILGIYCIKFEEIKFNDSTIKNFNSILYEMIIKMFNHKYNVSDFDSNETTFTTYSNVRLTWEIIHKKLLILKKDKQNEYENQNKKLEIQNSNTIFGIIENFFNPKNINELQITNGESIPNYFSNPCNSLITY